MNTTQSSARDRQRRNLDTLKHFSFEKNTVGRQRTEEMERIQEFTFLSASRQEEMIL
jgi:hypothetical protein